jgi:hypothetical protein
MSYDVITKTVAFPITPGQVVDFAYPTGRTAAHYRGQGAVMVGSAGTVVYQASNQFSVSYTPSQIRVTYGAAPQLASGVTILRAPLAFEYAAATSPNEIILTQAAYDALATKDANTEYVIVG